MEFRRHFISALLLVVVTGLTAQAQSTSCVATDTLDANNVSASVYNNGFLFWNGRGNEYTVPKGGRARAIFNAGLWVGGMVGGELRMAATDYGPAEFRPGPYLESGYDCASYNRICNVSRKDVLAFEAGAAPTPDLRDWPWDLGAPVMDGDGNPNNYDLNAGDRPAPIGDQVIWWIMNDGGEHAWTQSAPVRLEVRVTASSISRNTVEQFYHAEVVSEHLDNSTFYRYQIRYLGQTPLDSAYVGLFVDPDLGDASDDYVGSDSALGLGFSYNGDDFDAGSDGYGDRPPAIGVDFMQGLRAPADDGIDNDRDGFVDEEGERLQMTAFVTWPNSGLNPSNADQWYFRLQARWNDGSPVTEGCIGTGPSPCGDSLATPSTTFMYPAEPGEYWSEERHDKHGHRNGPSNMIFIMSMGPITMQPGEEQDFLVGLVWARSVDRLNSVRELKEADRMIQGLVNAGLFEPERAWHKVAAAPEPPPEPPQGSRFVLGRNHPNPFRTSTAIPYHLPVSGPVSISVHDLLGREVARLVDGVQAAGPHEVSFDAGRLPAGVYFYRMSLRSETVTGTMVLAD